MALQACHECGKQVSTEAASCPSCGAPVKKPSSISASSLAKYLLIVFAGIWFIIIVLHRPDPPPPPPSSEQVKRQVEERIEEARVFQEYMDSLKTVGLFKSTKEDGTRQIVYVDGALWKGSNYEIKENVLRVIAKGYELDRGALSVEVRDVLSGEVYGQSTPLSLKVYK